MRRLYFLVPDKDTTRAIVGELKSYGVDEGHLHVVASDKVALDDLPEPGAGADNDLWQAAKRGAAAGGSMGAVAGLVAVTVPPVGLSIAGGALLAAGGATFGAWASALVGASVPNSRVQAYRDALAAGRFMMLVDVGEEDEEPIRKLILRHHSEVSFESSEYLPPN